MLNELYRSSSNYYKISSSFPTTNAFRQFLPKGEDLPVPGLSKIEDLPESEDKKSISKINKKQSS